MVIMEKDLLPLLVGPVTTASLSERFGCEQDEVDIALVPLVRNQLIKSVDVQTSFGPVPGYAAVVKSARLEPPHRASRGQRIDMAVSFLRARPDHKATEAEIRAAIRIHPNDPPMSWLAQGVNDGRLEFAGDMWTLGPRSRPKIDSTKIAGALLARAASTFRCGRFSDGSVEFQRGGKVVAVLTRDEAMQVAGFLREAV